MNAASWQAARALFEQALELPPGDRAAFVAAGTDDVEVRAEVWALLAADTDATPAQALLDRGAVLPAAPAPLAGGKLGGFVLQRVLGQGGMGTVWLAEQQQPRRLVALKVLAVGLRSEAALRRFQFEAEVLGRLRHPNIAQVYEASVQRDAATAMDVPFFAMELVADARDLLAWADARQLPPPQRIELLLQLCDAVHYGHQHGVVHRDLKPQNVLVDADGRVKVIDFGIARCAEAPKSAQTLPGLLLGTLAYMSPEQLAGQPVDTRTDVWALGAIACELLTGQSGRELRGLSPSQALARLQQEPLRLPPSLPPDLRWILQTAQALEPERRYASAAALASDLRAFAQHLPIQARPPSASYQLSRFARRHRGLVAASALLLLLLTVGLVVVVVQNRRIDAQRQLAELQRGRAELQQQLAEQQRGRAEQQRQLAELQRGRAERVARFARDALAQTHALSGRGPNATLRQALDDAAAHVDDEPWTDPVVEADIKDLLGSCYRSLSLPDVAAPFLERALQLRRSSEGADARSALELEQELALLQLDRDQPDAALAAFAGIRARSAAAFGDRDPLTLSAAHDLALAQRRAGQLAAAEAGYREVLAARREVLGADDAATLVTQHNLGVLLLNDGRAGDARELLQDCLDRRRASLGEDAVDTLLSADNLGECYRDLGQIDRAIALHREAAAGLRQRLGDAHEYALGAAYHLLVAQSRKGDIAAMLQTARAILPHCERTFGADDRRTLDVRSAIAAAAMADGDFAAAEPELRAILVRMREGREPGDAAVANAEQNLAVTLLRQQRADDALLLLEPQLRRLDAGAELPLPVAATARLLHAQALLQKQRVAEAEAQLRALREELQQQLADQHPLRLKVAEVLAEACAAAGKDAEAAALRGEAAGR